MAQKAYGTITITDTNDINRIYVEYCRSTSNQLSGTTVPDITRAWGETTPEWVDGQYIWQRTVVEKSGTLEKSYGKPVCLTGAQGETGEQGPQGNTGAAGRSLTSTVTQYTTATNDATITQSNMDNYTWSNNVPTYNSNTPAYWVRITNTYSNPSSTQYIFYKDNGITDAIKTSNDANTTATTANTKADNAVSTANSANTTANQTQTNLNNYITSNNNAMTALQTKTKYFWTNLVAHTNGSGGWTKPNYPVGTYAASGISGTTFDEEDSSTYGYNTLYANGIKLRYNAINLGELTGSSLIFYKPSTTSQGGKAMELSGSALKFYNPDNGSISMMDLTSSGLTFKTAAGATIGTFGSDTSGGLLDLSGRLNIRGGGRIGQDSDNYWEFGDNRSYNDEDSAYLIGKGTASIQLGSTGHWRLDSNRIHTGWYQLSDSSSSTPAGSLHFDTGTENGSTYYWDYGMHYPDKAGGGNNKFLYIRRSNATTSTTLGTMKGRIDDDTYWVYKFYVDGSGNVHAPGFYIGDSTTPIGGGAGTVAEKLMSGAGSTTHPVYFRSDSGHVGELAETTYALNAAGAKGVITDIANNTTSADLPTTAAVVSYVTSRGYITSYTDNKVQTSQANTTKIYLTGTSTAGTSTGTLNFDSNVYLTTTAGTLHATTFEGNLSGTASRATADSDGNTIKTTYLKLSGGQVTGPVTFGSSVSADELTVGDLVVNGAASFTNGLYGDLIGNADTATKVGKDLKIQLNSGTTEGTNQFTFNGSTAKTVNITKSGIGLGNVENKSSATIRGELTSSNVTTALGFTPYNATNPNGYTTNTGTITSVRVQASSPLQSSTSTAQSETLNTTISFVNQNVNTVLAGPTSGSAAAAPTFRKLVAADIPDISGTYYLASNPSGYTTNTGTVTSVRVQASSPLTSTASTASSTTLDTTIKFSNQNKNLVLAGPSSGNTAAAPTFRSLVADDIPSISKSKISDFPASLKNPNALAIKVYNGTSTSSDTSYDGSTSGQSVSVAGTSAITGITASAASGGSTTFTLTKANGGTSTFDVTVTASVATGATTLTDTDGNAISTTGNTTPVWFESGIPKDVEGIAFSLLPTGTGASNVAVGNHTHGNITSGGDITATAPTIANGDQIVINDHSASKITNGPTFDGSTTTQFLTKAGTWGTPSGAVTGVKGNSESSYRTGQVNITKANIGLGNVDNTADANKNVLTATKFSSSRTITLTGDVTGSASGDGSSGWSISTAVGDDSHNHTVDTIIPKMTKTYTGVIATANTDAAAHMYNIKVLPTSYGGQWFIKYRVKATIAGVSAANGNGAQESIVYISGMRNTFSAYRVWNNIIHTSYRPYYYHTARFASEAAISEGHKLGISFRYAYNPATAANSREVIFEILDYGGCTISFLDSFITYADFPSTNYSNLTTFDGTTQGNTMSGDRNDVNYQNRINYTYKKPYATLYRYQILLSRADGTLLPVNSVENAPSNINKTLTTEEFDPFGEIYYYNSSTTKTISQNLDNSTLYRQILADLRYSFNITNESGKCLTGSQPVYIAATPQSNGMAKLASPALVQTLPSTEDDKIYIYIGQAYPDTYPYRTELPLYHPIYWYKNGAICQYVGNPYTVNGHTVASDVPANAVFTDTWKALSTSQAGYVSQAPNDTSKFLRGDASWAAVTKGNVGLGNVDNTADANKRVKGANITTTANAVAYYTDTAGTFGSKASANGALYATSANGALNWGTLPVAQGGTGATSFTANSVIISGSSNTAALTTRAITNVTDGAVTASTNLVTANSLVAHVANKIAAANSIYVTIATDQTITANQKTFNGAIRWSSSTNTAKYGAMHYDSTLEALVFSFA